MTVKRIPPPFRNNMRPVQTILGWCYVPVHIFVLPLLLNLLAGYSPGRMTEVQINFLYYGIGTVYLLCVMLPFLRRDFDVLVEQFRRCVLCVLLALLIDYAMTCAAALVLLLTEGAAENPNNVNVMELAVGNLGTVKALSIFLAPIVEELLFRGVIFGSLQSRNRTLAYVLSVGLFALYHVWQYVAAYRDPALLLYAVQYIPLAAALAWAYEHSGSLWTCIFFHMGFNALSFAVLRLM